ncbi:MAG TPA: hypothetical protein VL993_00660 [Stellaceae bacterium]|nr:hypothetical protein [Stellaceae bacterium]
MTFPNGLRNLAPEADLRNVVIRRREAPAPSDEGSRSLPQSDRAAGLFFSKGQATAQAFRPSYWTYGDKIEAGAADSGTVVDIRTAANSEARSGAADDDELRKLERAFYESQLKMLSQPPEPVSDRDASEMPAAPAVDPEGRAPEADLRMVSFRRTPIPAPDDDTLFLRKNRDIPAEKPAADAEPDKDIVETQPQPQEARPEIAPAAPAAPTKSKSRGRGKRSSKTTAGVGILAAGFSALVVSLWVLFDVNTPQTSVNVAVSVPRVLAPSSSLTAAAVPAAPSVPASVAPPAPAVVSPAPAAVPPPPVVAPHSTLAENYIDQGNDQLRNGDVFAARLFFKRAADAGDAHGALMMGVTYDPAFLSSIGVRGPLGDEATATSWYRRAAALGAPEATTLINGLKHKQ